MLRFVTPVALAFGLLLQGCGGGGSSASSTIGGGGGGGGGPVVPGQPNPHLPGAKPVLTDAQLETAAAALTAIANTRLSKNPAANPDARFNELTAFAADARKVARVVYADVDRTSLTSRVILEDGLAIYFPHNRPEPTAVTPAAMPTRSTSRAVFPEERLAYVFNNVPPEPQPAQTAKTLREAGYQVVEQVGTYENMTKMGKAAFVLYNGHGTWVEEVVQNSDGSLSLKSNTDGLWYWGMTTETVIDRANISQFRNELYAGSLFLYAREGTKLKLGIGPQTVRNTWSLDEAVVLFNSCLSAGERFSRSGWLETLRDKGAKAFGGWTSVCDTNSNRRSLSLVRMMTNAEDDFMKHNPLQRPLDFLEAYNEIKRAGLHAHPDDTGYMDIQNNTVLKTTTFLVTTWGSEDSRLKPKIANFEVKPEESGSDTLVIEGEFRPELPQVLVNGQALVIKSNTAKKIEAEIPDSGAGSAGELIVRQFGRDSNKTMITLWKPDLKLRERWIFTGEGSSGQITFEATIPCVFRGDVMGTRSSPSSAPTLSGFVVHQAKSVPGTYRLFGQITSSEGRVMKASGGGKIEILSSKVADQYSGLSGFSTREENSFGFSRFSMGANKEFSILTSIFTHGTMETTVEGHTSSSPIVFGFPGFIQEGWSHGMVGQAVRLKGVMNSDYSLAQTESHTQMDSEGIRILKEVWIDRTYPSFAPTQSLPRSVN